MLRLSPVQLKAHLQKTLCRCYVLSGQEPLLLDESRQQLIQAAQQQGFSEQLSLTLEPQTDWEALFQYCQSRSLFSQRQILVLSAPTLPANATDALTRLAGLLHADLLVILSLPSLSKAQENSRWFRALLQQGGWVVCTPPTPRQLPDWVRQRAHAQGLELDDAACQLLCYCYEGHLLALSQVLTQLALMWPEGRLTLPRVEQVVSDAAHFAPWHWVEALLEGKSKRAHHILQQLWLEGVEPVMLLRALQRELMLLLTVKLQQPSGASLRALFDQHKVWQARRAILSQALQRLSLAQLQQAIHLLAELELTVKRDFGADVRDPLERLSLLLSGLPLAL